MKLSKNSTAAVLIFLLASAQGTSALDGWEVLFGAVVGAATALTAPAALAALGFTSAGVAAGSVAAAIQSSAYGGYVGAGSVFAVAQSTAAVGVTTGNVVTGAAIGACKAVVASALHSSRKAE